MNRFRERLNETFKYSGISHIELALKIVMTQIVVNIYCTGKREPTLDVLVEICKALEVSADELLGLKD